MNAKAKLTELKLIEKRLEHLRKVLRAENISYGELAELQSLAKYIKPDDVELLEAAGVPENPCSLENVQYGAQIYVYAPVDANGEPQAEGIDVQDAQEALQEAPDFYWYCKDCGEDFHDWDEVTSVNHIGVSHARNN